MIVKQKQDRMAWFKMDAGAFIAETTGFSNNHIGIYIKLMNLYWTGGNRLPDEYPVLKRRLGVSDASDVEMLEEILTEYFPKDTNNIYRHSQLDGQLKEVKDFSQLQSERASKPRGRVSQPNNDGDVSASDF